MLRLQCKIIIEHNAEGGKKIVSFDYVNAIEVKTSTKDFTDTATVKVPRKMYWKGHNIMEYLKRNDAITIQMGYSNFGTVATVFKGYISTIENSSPIVISCENIMRHFKTITVEPEIIPDFDIADYLAKYAPDVNVICPDNIGFGKVVIKKRMSLTQALDQIRQAFPWFKGYFKINGDFVVITDTEADRNTINLDPERNIITDNLKYILAEDVKVKIKMTSILPDNKKLEVTVPEDDDSDYEQRQYLSKKTTAAELKAEAEQRLATFKSDKMSGDITIFGVPFVQKGDIVRLNDKIRTERDGMKFLAEAVTYSFNEKGYRQRITLGNKIA